MAQFAPSALKSLFAGLNCPIDFYSKSINSFTRHGHRRAQFTPPAALVARWCGWPCGRRAGGGWCKCQHTTQAARRPCWPCLALPLGWRAGVGGVSCLAGRLRGVSLRFRCAGGIITPAAPVALNIRPFPCLVSIVYTSTSRANAGGGLAGLVWPFPVLALRLLGWLAAPVRIIIRRRDFIPARLALPVARICAPVLAVSRRFGGVSALRWCPMLARCPCARFAGVGVLVR